MTDRERWRGAWTAAVAHNKGTALRGGGGGAGGCCQSGLQHDARLRQDEVRTPRHAAGTCKTMAELQRERHRKRDAE